ncbi:MAG: hypothetical protein AAF403_06585, partial [Pseudomonadota bacterium]
MLQYFGFTRLSYLVKILCFAFMCLMMTSFYVYKSYAEPQLFKISSNETIPSLKQKPIIIENQSQFDATIRQYLLDHPETIIEALQKFEQNRIEEQQKTSQDKLQELGLEKLVDEATVIGQGSITVVEFIDYQCGFCKRSFAGVKSVLA